MKVHRGMASAAARNVRFALDRYSVPAKGLEEGVEAYVAYSGKAADVVAKMENGLKASFGYSGAKSVRTSGASPRSATYPRRAPPSSESTL